MAKSVKKFKQVCKCENCGNEAEMVVTCTLGEVPGGGSAQPADAGANPAGENGRMLGTATCSHCGNEADMWVNISL